MIFKDIIDYQRVGDTNIATARSKIRVAYLKRFLKRSVIGYNISNHHTSQRYTVSNAPLFSYIFSNHHARLSLVLSAARRAPFIFK